MTAPQTPKDHALAYAKRGWPCFPCRHAPEDVVNPETGEVTEYAAKTPLTGIGFRAASSTPRIIERWWKDWPQAMIGVPTGDKIKAWVLDIDPRHGGDTSLAALEDEHGPLPDTLTARTAGGGRHYYFAHVKGVRNRASLGDGIDVRGDGGYVIAPGSVTHEGRDYHWERDCEPADAPQWLLDMVVRKEPPPGPVTPQRASTNSAYVDAAIDRELATLAATPMGNRNNALNDAAFALGSFVGAGALGEQDARNALQATAKQWGRDWPRCAKTIENGLKAGMAAPRDIPEPQQKDAALVAEGARIAAALLKGAPTDGTAEPPPLISATPWAWKDPASLPRRQWLYGKHYVRKYVSLTVAPGGLGKSSNAIAEALAMATGRPLLGVKPEARARVWYFNGEDDRDELDRRIAAACKRFGIAARDIEGWLFVDSGREQSIVVMEEVNRALRIAHPIVDAVKATIKANRIDCVIVDPFVSTHAVPENDNGAIDKVAKLWAKIADETNTADELIHHVKKTEGREIAVEDARGAGALLAAARSVRVLNRMSEDQAAAAGIAAGARAQYFSIQVGKANLAQMAGLEWRYLDSVALGNGTGIQKAQDHAGVVTEWVWPSAEAIAQDVPAEALKAIKARIGGGNYAASEQSKKFEWAGHVVAEVLEIDLEDKAGVRRVRSLLDAWEKAGHFEKVTRGIPNGKGRNEQKTFLMPVMEQGK